MKLLDHQIEDVNFLTGNRYALLCNEPGTGKTVSAISALEKTQIGGTPSMIVAKKSHLVNVWEPHLAEWSNFHVETLYEGRAIQRKLRKKADIYLLPYTMLRSYSKHAYYAGLNEKGRSVQKANNSKKALNSVDINVLVVDECHNMLQPTSQRTRALWALREQAGTVWGLTGTPLTKNVDQIWCMLRLLDRKTWPSKTAFRNEFIDGHFDHFQNWVSKGIKPHKKAAFDRMVAPFTRRVLLEDVKKLPESEFERIVVPLSLDQRLQLDNLKSKGFLIVDEKVILPESAGAIHQWKRKLSSGPIKLDGEIDFDNSPKMYQLMKLHAAGMRLVVVCYFRSVAESIRRRLHAPIVFGGTTATQKSEAVGLFESGKVDNIVLTYGAGSEGLTLTSADAMVRVERTYNLTEHIQMMGRIRRLSSDGSPIRYIDIISEDETELKPIENIQHKIDHLAPVVVYKNG